MNKSKTSSEEPEADRLSDLPNSLIFEIFWRLPMRDVVKTTILSKRWENLWTTTPYLDFDRHAPEFVNRALALWTGLKILKFKFNYCSVGNKSVFRDVDAWVRLATENGVEELYLEEVDFIFIPPNLHTLYGVPHCLYSCSSLKMLSLIGCNFENPGNMQWNQLRSLRIEGFFVDQNLIDELISGSPQLEVLNLTHWDRVENLSIRSTSLRELFIWRTNLGYQSEQPSTDSELRIWCPNVETLDISGVSYVKCLLMNVSSLTHLALGFSDSGGNDEMFGETLGEIFSTIQHVEKLTLSGWCIKVLGAMKEKYLHSPLSNFNFLEISIGAEEYEQAVDLLQIFTQLKTLVLHSTYYSWNHVDSFFHGERNLPSTFLLQLRTVEINCMKGDSLIFPFIETLLKHASKLQKMAIRVIRMKPPLMPWFLALQQKVLKVPRSSPTAELLFFAEY